MAIPRGQQLVRRQGGASRRLTRCRDGWSDKRREQPRSRQWPSPAVGYVHHESTTRTVNLGPDLLMEECSDERSTLSTGRLCCWYCRCRSRPCARWGCPQPRSDAVSICASVMQRRTASAPGLTGVGPASEGFEKAVGVRNTVGREEPLGTHAGAHRRTPGACMHAHMHA